METNIREREVLIQALLTATSDAVLITDVNGVVVEANERLAQRLHTTPEMLRGVNIYDVLPPALGQLRRERVQAVIASQQPAQFEDHVGEQWLENTFVPILHASGQVEHIVVCSRDVTMFHQSELHFRRLFEVTPFPLVITQIADSHIVAANQAALTYFDVERPEIRSIKGLDFYANPADRETILLELQTIGKIENKLLELQTRTGERRWNLVNVHPLEFDGHACLLIGLADITDRQHAEEQLRQMLREKTALLREVHHRVKNNLQVVSSMLYLQAEATQDEQTLKSLQESQNRIQAMALVHEQLYASNNLAEIDMAVYLEELATAMYHAYHVNIEQIRLQLDMMPLMLNIEQAIPCGLIVQELLSNAFKHGFPAGQAGEVGIACRTEDHRIVLKVWNSGTRFPEQIDLHAIKTVGLDLVRSFTRQLRGTLELDRTEGTHFTISFSKRGQ